MNLVGWIGISVLAALWLAIAVVWMRTGRAKGPLALGILPAALLFITVPSAIGVLQLIRGFQQIAQQGAGGVAAIAPYCVGIPRDLRWGVVALLMTLGAAVALQGFAAPGAEDEADPSAQPADSRTTLAGLILGASAALILPAALEVNLVREIPRLVGQAVKPLTQPEMADMSRAISSRLVLAAAGGVGLSAVLLISALGTLLAVCLTKAPGWTWRFSWIALGAAGLLAVWLLLGASADIHVLERALR